MPLSLSFFLDSFSCWFMTAVLLISSVVIVYSYFYMSPYHKSSYFLYLTLLFILSMLLVITMSNLILVMLGWDGLGLVSFFLIVFYQNQSSILSGLTTVMMNRIGDCFFLIAIVLYSYFYYDYFVFTSLTFPTLLIRIMIITFITKRAIYPFSPWLPMAIRAPTPISALVHSSTLVTSGLFLMIKYSYCLYRSYPLMLILLSLSLFTSFYAGMNTIFEFDMKKLIALSTLSHLGFIGIAFSVGLLHLAFFHLMTHALFKSLLFMTIGDIIIRASHSQDIRYLSMGICYTPFSCIVMFVSLLNLLGIPSLSGFYSKDLVIEMMNYTFCGTFLSAIMYLNIGFTFYYTYSLFYYSFSSNKLGSYSIFHSPLKVHTYLLFMLGMRTLFFGKFYLSVIVNYVAFLPVSSYFKRFPLVLNLVFFLSILCFLGLYKSSNRFITSYFSTIMFLTFFVTSIRSRLYYNLSFRLVKSLEQGALNFTLNPNLSSLIQVSSLYSLKMTFRNPLFLSLAFFSSVMFLSLL